VFDYFSVYLKSLTHSFAYSRAHARRSCLWMKWRNFNKKWNNIFECVWGCCYLLDVSNACSILIHVVYYCCEQTTQHKTTQNRSWLKISRGRIFHFSLARSFAPFLSFNIDLIFFGCRISQLSNQKKLYCYSSWLFCYCWLTTFLKHELASSEKKKKMVEQKIPEWFVASAFMFWLLLFSIH
jgi:hypothetical protein